MYSNNIPIIFEHINILMNTMFAIHSVPRYNTYVFDGFFFIPSVCAYGGYSTFIYEHQNVCYFIIFLLGFYLPRKSFFLLENIAYSDCLRGRPTVQVHFYYKWLHRNRILFFLRIKLIFSCQYYVTRYLPRGTKNGLTRGF